MKANLVIERPAVLGEGPWWDGEREKLWWIDGLSENGQGDDLHCFDPASGGDTRWHIGKHIGCAVPARDGRVLLTLWDGIWLFDPRTGGMESAAAWSGRSRTTGSTTGSATGAAGSGSEACP